MHWVSWKTLSTGKQAGGLGFKDLQSFNKALLGKQIWRLLTCPNLLLSKVLKARYYPKTTLFNCEIKGNASWIWKSLMSAREVVQCGARKQIGNGNNTRIWEDAWLLEGKGGKIESTKPPGCNITTVSELIANFRWKSTLIFRLFSSHEAAHILKTPISLTGRPDCYF